MAGTGVILANGDSLPVGPLSPIFTGDTLVIREGKVTVLDLRTGRRHEVDAKRIFTLPRTAKREPQPWYERLRDLLVQSLRGPDLKRTGGSVRATGATAWPDGVRYAPGVTVIFRWAQLPPVRHLRIVRDSRDTSLVSVTGVGADAGAIVWPLPEPPREGSHSWSLLDADGEVLFGARFEVLGAVAADSLRHAYEEAARLQIGTEAGQIGAALLAAADRFMLW